MEAFDLVVIGAGPAGEKGAAQAAYFGRRVALVEQAPALGGAGVNTGTIPSKTLRETALFFSGLRHRGLYGVDPVIKPELTVRDFLHREQDVVRSLQEVVAENVARHRIALVRGRACFEDAHTVRVDPPGGGPPRRLRGDVILVATGSVPNPGRDLPRDDPRVYDSDSILAMRRLPRRLGVVGAGVIGCEYACTFAALGIEVLVVDGRRQLLSFLDGEIGDRLRLGMERLGIRLALGDALARVECRPEAIGLELASGGGGDVDALLVAAGRLGATAGLGLERIGVPVGDRGHLAVNEHFQTAVPHVYAAGDVTGFPALAATGMEQARVAMCHAFDLGYKTRVAPVFPMAVYTIPEAAGVGLTEEGCRDREIDHAVGRALYRGNARAQIIGDLSGVLKLVFRADDRRLLGVHAIGEQASELIHAGLMVLQLGGGIDVFIDAVFNYPTLSEAYKYAAYDGLGALRRR
jgi:NAD(P) transhydrogenase